MPHPTDPSRDLLFCLLALQNGLIDQGALITAFAAWMRDKARPLADHLVELGHLDAPRRAAVEAIAGLHVQALGGDIEKSLGVLAVGRSTRASLARAGGPEVEATLGHVRSTQGSTHDDDPDRTGTYSLGSATSDGQRFRILRPHAHGGLGAVFVAIDNELNREVALKEILDHHADNPASRQRFLIEAEITGGLEHPGIVPVYGLGTYAGGRPYYAMRFIKGDSLKEAIKRFHGDVTLTSDPAGRSLALRKLLRTFTDVCNAIDYAHNRGVLHRDIKPGNIIVGKYGETLVVDWGLAKPLGRVEPGQESGERTLVPSSASGSAETLPGSALGTPAYMSPEQASGELDRMGSRSDVYSLGATLYCLLTGRPPFEGADIGEVLGKVQRGEFVPPRSLDPTIDPALEAVCKKAMALKPEGRYATCRALADDVERWMADEPVTAWREPFARRARRWARRNRTVVTSLTAAVLVALAGTAAVLAVQTQANGRLKQANSDLAVANGLVTKANADLKLANAREKQRFDLAMEAIKLFHGEVGDDLVLKADQFKPLRDKLLRGALDFYGKLEGLLQGQPDKGTRGAMGNAYFALGELTAKIGDKPAALAAHRKGLAVRRELASEPAADAEACCDVARSLFAAGLLLIETGNSAQALAHFDEARDLLEDLPLTGPGSDGRRALVGTIYAGIGVMLERTGKPAAGRASLQRSVDRLTRLADDNPAVTEFRSRLANTHNIIGNLQSGTGKPVEALESYRRALAIGRKLADDDPAVTQFQNQLADTHNNIGFVQAQTGKPGEALESYRRAVAIQQKLADDNPAVTDFRSRLAGTHNNIGNLQSDTGKPVEALYSFGMAVTILQKLADDNPAFSEFRNRLADSHTNIGWLLVQNGRAAEAVAECSRAEAIQMRLVQENPSVPDYRNRLASCQTNTATALLHLGRPAEARALCERAVRLEEALVKDDPETAEYRVRLGESLLRCGLARRDQGDAAGAAADWRRADALLEGAGTLAPDFTFIQACCHSSLSWAAGRTGSGVSAGEAEAEAAKALGLLRRAAETGFRNLATYRNETALDTLRDRAEFRLLLMDLAFPTAPFAH
jgi:eukaryotic-like serine/threonine-protein kinase